MDVPRNTKAIDEAVRLLREATFSTDVERVVVTVRNDGRVELVGETGAFVRWKVYGDLLESSVTQRPSAAFCDAWLANQSKETA